MKLRMPAYPIIAIDPYFSVWSCSDELNKSDTQHWTGVSNKITATVEINGVTYRLMGVGDGETAQQLSVECDVFTTTYMFLCGEARVKMQFFSPLLCNDIELLSRPISFLEVGVFGTEKAKVCVMVSDELCLEYKKKTPVVIEKMSCKYPTIRMGAKEQNILARSGDLIRIDYGYLYVSVKEGQVGTIFEGDSNYLTAVAEAGKENVLFAFGYDDIYSLEYFGSKCKSFWNKDGRELVDEIDSAFENYQADFDRCEMFGKEMIDWANKVGGEKYAELLAASYRQVMAAHKTVIDPDGNLLWISKENSSNGCAATVDVTYPSAPIFMLYNVELLKGMLRPIFLYAESKEWEFDFAPHDVGTFPLANGQTYGRNPNEGHMPVEECGNMLILASAIVLIEKNYDFVKPYMHLLKKWADYLVNCGFDPDNQLCTDDFAGHLSHNCNLSIKAICGLGAFARLLNILGDIDEAQKYENTARKFALEWEKAALNGDRYVLAFDRPDSFSMKYNLVWDKLMNLGLFSDDVYKKEITYYIKNSNKYGIPLDNRADYTKSDWIVWSATLSESREDFNALIAPLWDAYNETEDRVPMTDWYMTSTAKYQMFKNRTVLGGFWIKLLDDKNIF